LLKKIFDELAGLTTEQRNSRSMKLDAMTTREILATMNAEDRTVPEVVAQALPQIEQAVELITASFQRGGRLIYVGAGTSGRLGVLDAAECPPTFGSEPWQVQGFIAGGQNALVRAVEGAEDSFEQAAHDLEICALNEADVVVGITASRRTPYVLGALSYAGERGAKRVFIICNTPSDIPVNGGDKIADVIISIPVGPELLTGSTRLKAGTASKLVLNMLSTAAWVRTGKCYENLMVDLRMGSMKLRARARKIMIELTGCDYDWADEILNQADNELKTALVMHFKGVTAEHAREMLEEKGGSVRSVIEEKLKNEN
jgi:N-acetylmuramic acid 6-phosphate etherase